MNIAISESSLYQLTQDFDEPLISLSIGAETLKEYVSSLVELLIDERLRATVWVKLPQTKSWIKQVQKLQNEGNVEHIFICNSLQHQANLSLLKSSAHQAQTSFSPLKQNQTLQRESFLIVAAPTFQAVIVSQWQKGRIEIDPSGKRLQQPYLEMVCSFTPQAVKAILNGVQANTTEPIDFSHNYYTAPHGTSSQLLSSLILKQVNHHEKVQSTLNSLSKSNHHYQPSSTVLGLQEDFLNNLVQELRSPITHMKTALSLLESRQIKGEQRQRYLQMVNDECDRQNSLVSGLLGLLQLDTPTDSEYLCLDDLIPGIVSTYQPLAEEKEILLGYTVPAALPPISCPRPWFRQIIINLLNNSLQFTPPQGRVFVQASLKSENEQVEIVVSDTGIGIPSKEIHKIFDGFYRTKSPAQTSGAGLGLTLVKQLIERCGGTIFVNSRPSKGTTFKIQMPAVPRELA